jgi:DNA polymerase (family X)
MAGLDASAVANLLKEFGQRTELRGGNPYRARAYTRAAENLRTLTLPLETVIAQERLREIPGVGEAIADIITRLHRTGTHPALEAMRKEMPESALEMLSIPGLRAEKVIKLYRELGISSLEELEEAARQSRLQSIKGLGPALQNKILQGIEIKRRGQGQRHIHRAAQWLATAEANLRASHPDLKRVTPAGEFRRGCELVSDLCLVAEAPGVKTGAQKIQASEQFTIYLTDTSCYGITLLLATGSHAHLESLRALAKTRDLVLDESGLRRGRKIIASKDENVIYAALDLPFIEPELRESGNEVSLALEGRLSELVTDRDIQGILHAHTELSDGADTLEKMAAATRSRGYTYFGVADHSQSAGYAGGLKIEEIADQHAAIERLNKSYGGEFRVFKGIESDILPDGSLDYPDEVLATFDFVVASVHSRFRLEHQVQTERIIRAVSNPRTTILGHMTGRQLLRRPGYDVDIEKILSACASHGVAVEINANPWRLDLDWRWHGRALELGCMMSINPDAHSISEIDLTHWGVEMARKGGVPKDRVLNCLGLPAFVQHLENRRRRPLRKASAPAANSVRKAHGRRVQQRSPRRKSIVGRRSRMLGG